MGFLAPVVQFVGAIFVGAGAGASAGYVLAVNVARLGLLALSAKVFTPKPDFTETAQSKRITFRDPIAPQVFVYGEDMISGPMMYSNVAGAENRDLYIVVALTGHEIDSVTGYRIDSTDIPLSDVTGAEDGDVTNGNKFDGVATVALRKGTATQTTIPALISVFPGNFNAAHTGRGWSYMLWEFNLVEGQEDVFKTQPSNLRAIVRGKKVYDPRLDTTNGGTGPHRLADPTTWEWSDNPALCLADFIRDDKFGMREDDARVDWPLVIAAADICDQTVTVPAPTNSQKRYTCNATFSSDESRGSVRDELLAAMLGRMVFSQGKWKIWAGAAITPDVTLSEANLSGGVTVQASSPSNERYNRVRGKYIDPDRNYVASTYVEQRSSAFEAEDGGEVRELVADFTSTQNEFEAQRKAIATLKQSRQQRVLVFEGNYSCFRIQPGTTVLLDVAELGFSGEKFFVTEWRFNNDGVALTMVEEIDSAWADPLVGDYSTRSPTGVLTFAETGVPAPTALAAAATLEGNLVSWTNPLANTFAAVQVWASDDNDRNNATLIATVTGTSYLEPIIEVAFRTRYYWVRAVDSRGRVSAFTPDLTTTTVFVSPLSNRANLNADPEFDFSNLAIDGAEPNPFWRGATGAGTGSVTLNVGAGAGGSNTVDFVKGTSTILTLESKRYSLWRKSRGTFLLAIKYRTIGTADALDHTSYRFAITTTDDGDNPASFNTFFGDRFTLPRNATANWHTFEGTLDFEILQPSSIPDDYIRFELWSDQAGGTADTLRVDSFVVVPIGTNFGSVVQGTSLMPGLVPQAESANATQFLRGDGAWADAGGGGIADGTVTGAMLYWNGSAWVEETGIQRQPGRLDLVQSTQAILRLHATNGPADEERTDVRQVAFSGFVVQAVNASGLNADVLLSGIRSGTGWTRFELRAPLFITEQAAAATSSAGLGAIWVKNDIPNTLWFTDDAGTDHQLGAGGGVTSVTAGQGLTQNTTTGDVTINVGVGTGLSVAADSIGLNYSALAEKGSAVVGTDRIAMTDSAGLEFVHTVSNIPLSAFNNDAGFTTGGVNISGTPADNQIAVWTNANTIEGDTGLGYDTTLNQLLVLNDGAIRIDERATGPSGITAHGLIWVRNDTPNVLMFTDDAGNEVEIGGASVGVTSVTAGQGLTQNQTTGAVTLNVGVGTGLSVAADSIGLNYSALSEKTGALVGTDRIAVASGASEVCETISGIPLSIFNNDAGWTANVGDITNVTAGTGLSGGGASGSVTLALDFDELSLGGTLIATDHLIASNGGVETRQLISGIPLSIFNNDAGFSTGGGVLKRKTAATSRNSATYVDDPHLLNWTLAAGQWYSIDGILSITTGSATPDIKLRWQMSRTPQNGGWMVDARRYASTGTIGQAESIQATATTDLILLLSPDTHICRVSGIMESSAAGTTDIDLEWAQNTLDVGNNVTINEGSWISFTEI